VGVLVLILLVFGVKGCLDARKERAFENYNSDLSAIVAETENLTNGFFDRLQDPGNLTPLQFEAEVKADRGAAEGLLDRAEGLDAPDQLTNAQELVVLSYQLRRDGLAAVSNSIAQALGDRGARKAARAIADEMRTFSASDVLSEKAEGQITATLEEEGVEASDENISAQFLPNDPNWLDADEVASALGVVSGGGDGEAAPGVHGLGLGTVTLLPTGASIEAGVPVTAAADGAELEVQVENQGESEETDLTVTYEISGGGESSRGRERIARIDAGEVATVNIPIQPAPSPGTVELTVIVEPVPGEEIEDNNEVTGEVTFE
jgi:hypothetical protein